MRKSNTIGGIIDQLEYYEAKLNLEIKWLKDPKYIGRCYSIHSALNRRNTAMKSLKQLLF